MGVFKIFAFKQHLPFPITEGRNFLHGGKRVPEGVQPAVGPENITEGQSQACNGCRNAQMFGRAFCIDFLGEKKFEEKQAHKKKKISQQKDAPDSRADAASGSENQKGPVSPSHCRQTLKVTDKIINGHGISRGKGNVFGIVHGIPEKAGRQRNEKKREEACTPGARFFCQKSRKKHAQKSKERSHQMAESIKGQDMGFPVQSFIGDIPDMVEEKPVERTGDCVKKLAVEIAMPEIHKGHVVFQLQNIPQGEHAVIAVHPIVPHDAVIPA